MPSFTISLPDLQSLIGKKITILELEDLIEYAKGEVESFDEKTGEMQISLDDTNLPYLWSSEGLARYFKGVLGIEKGIPKLNTVASGKTILVERSIHSIRPHISAFIAKGKPLTDYSLRQLVQLQEKFCGNYGRKRKNASIGLYASKKITFPVHYKAVLPDSARFVPLEFDKPLTLREILREHPKGIEFGEVISSHSHYPLLIDDAEKVLSFPPIINSNDLGKLEVGDTEFLFECTGLDEETVTLGTNIFAYALQDRGYTIQTLIIQYPQTKNTTPNPQTETITINHEMIKNLLGLDLTESAIKKLLEKARYEYDAGKVTIPAFRKDIMHPVDIIEDIGILYNFNSIESSPLTTYTVGKTTPLQGFVDTNRELAIGLGYQEVFSTVLSNKNLLYEKTRLADMGTIEIEKYMSENFSVVRTTLLPILLDMLSKNKHIEYPQKIFEQGLVTRRHNEAIVDYELLTLASTHAHVAFTEIKQAADSIISSLGITATYEELENQFYINGRAAQIKVQGTVIGMLGEVHPQTLQNFGLELPVVMMELNLTALYSLIKK